MNKKKEKKTLNVKMSNNESFYGSKNLFLCYVWTFVHKKKINIYTTSPSFVINFCTTDFPVLYISHLVKYRFSFFFFFTPQNVNIFNVFLFLLTDYKMIHHHHKHHYGSLQCGFLLSSSFVLYAK
jgi:hypothetical protein